MFTIACCLVVALGLGLGLDLVCDCAHVFVLYFCRLSCHTASADYTVQNVMQVTWSSTSLTHKSMLQNTIN